MNKTPTFVLALSLVALLSIGLLGVLVLSARKPDAPLRPTTLIPGVRADIQSKATAEEKKASRSNGPNPTSPTEPSFGAPP